MSAVNMFTFWSFHIIAKFCVKTGEFTVTASCSSLIKVLLN